MLKKESSFAGFLDGMSEQNEKVKRHQLKIVVDKKVKKMLKTIAEQDRTIISLRKSLKKLRKQMKDSESITYGGEDIKWNKKK